jgi:hypothetical protein
MCELWMDLRGSTHNPHPESFLHRNSSEKLGENAVAGNNIAAYKRNILGDLIVQYKTVYQDVNEGI